MISEITPIKYRGKSLVIINFFVSIGKIFGCILAIIFLKSFTEGNWKAMMFTSGIPSLIVFIGGKFYILESP
jgi:putative MFS transporter